MDMAWLTSERRTSKFGRCNRAEKFLHGYGVADFRTQNIEIRRVADIKSHIYEPQPFPRRFHSPVSDINHVSSEGGVQKSFLDIAPDGFYLPIQLQLCLFHPDSRDIPCQRD
jgi:hypothetical protein